MVKKHIRCRRRMDLMLNPDRPATSSQMDNMFDPFFTSFGEKLKLLEDKAPSSSDVDMVFRQTKSDKKYMFDPIPIMPKTISFRENLDRLDGLTDFISKTPSGVNEAPATGEKERFAFGDQLQSSGLGCGVNGASTYFVNAETQSHPHPFIVPDLGDFNAGTYNCFSLPYERRHKWMVRSRRAAARSMARRLGRMENCQLKKQRLDELD